MDSDAFRHWSAVAANWGADYRDRIREYPVRAQTAPGEISAQIPGSPPEAPEAMAEIFADFERIILPGMTHWQHPRFFAYFPANAAPASVVAEYLVSAMAAQCMLWQTSPAATELEGRMLEWLRQAVGLPAGFTGVIQDSASTATLAAVLTMRERALGWAGNREGLANQPHVRVYASDQVHSSIDRAVWISGIGAENLVRVPTAGPLRGMDSAALEASILQDQAAGYLPAGVIACVGATGAGATDDVRAVCEVARRHGLMTHVDAAWAGSAMICPEFRHYWDGVELADSVVFNPHKWLGAQFDCSAHFLRDPEDLLRTLAIHPDYLATHGAAGITDYSEWSIPLGRRFRALKLWFLLRAHGLEGLRQMIRHHVAWSAALAERLAATPAFALLSPPMLSLFAFRHEPPGVTDLDAHNLALLQTINADGRIYLTQANVDGHIGLRFQVGQFETTALDVALTYDVITELATDLAQGYIPAPSRPE
ncbi:MAG: aspartate aminotransferase family protein [Thermomicrobiales bacterium]|nr:aspartate aminotransferase family protein [Thermomicrobiales bacterium]